MIQKRIWIFLGAVGLLLLVIAARIFSSQVISNDYYLTQARKYATRIELMSDPRGKILDRNGNILVTNKLTFDLYVTPAKLIIAEPKPVNTPGVKPAPPKTVTSLDYLAIFDVSLEQSQSVRQLAQLLNCTPDALIDKIRPVHQKILASAENQSERVRRQYLRGKYREKYKFLSGISVSQAMEIDAHPEVFTGFSVSQTITRQYAYDELACHLIGYVGLVWKEEYQALLDKNYFRELLSPDVDENTYLALTDMGEFKDRCIGRVGIERLYDRQLSGKAAVRLSEYDSVNKQVEELSRTGSEPPADIALTIDLNLQKKMEAALRGKIGAAIVMDVNSGEILAMASAPSFNPNHLQTPIERQTANFIATSPTKPLYNRAVSGEYPPGSIFKIITGIAALEAGKVTPYTTFNCSGYFYPSIKKFACWISAYGRNHGDVNMEEGFQHSCNVYFFHAGKAAGPENITYWADKFGFGKLTGIDMPGEHKGRVPKPPPAAQQSDAQPPGGNSPAASRTWNTSDTLNISIGQGDLSVTPLQIVRMIAAVSNGGKLVTPCVIKNSKSEIGNLKSDIVKLSPLTVNTVHRGMYKVVHSDGGTANGTDLKNYPVAAKTATAEVSGRISHAWIAGFAPYDKPRIAFVVIIEYGGKGSDIAGPVAAEFVPEALNIVSGTKPTPKNQD